MALHEPFLVSNWHNSASAVPFRDNARLTDRLAWADVAKGLGIFLVVLMHSTLGVGEHLQTTGWTHHIVAFAKPFRMPDFFLIAGMFASVAMAKPFRTFFDRRVLHFVYFYALWVVITLTVKTIGEHGMNLPAIAEGLLKAAYEPYSSLWFIYILPLIALALRLVHRLPASIALSVALGLHLLAAFHADGGVYGLAATLTPFFAVDAFCLFFIFFVVGHYARPWLLLLAEAASNAPAKATAALGLWAVANAAAVHLGVTEHALAILPAGLAGAMAVIVLAALLARLPLFGWLAYLGAKSLVIYLSFTIPMAITRIVLIKTGYIADVGWISAITFAVALLSPLLLAALVRPTPLAFLYRRPQWARLG